MKLFWRCRIESGKLIPVVGGLTEAIKDLPDGDYDLTIENHKNKRSNAQNRYLWLLYGILGDYLGYSPEEIHDICKYKFLRKTIHITKDDEDIEIIGSTKELSTTDIEKYMENVRRWGAELGVNLPLPNEGGIL